MTLINSTYRLGFKEKILAFVDQKLNVKIAGEVKIYLTGRVACLKINQKIFTINNFEEKD